MPLVRSSAQPRLSPVPPAQHLSQCELVWPVCSIAQTQISPECPMDRVGRLAAARLHRLEDQESLPEAIDWQGTRPGALDTDQPLEKITSSSAKLLAAKSGPCKRF